MKTTSSKKHFAIKTKNIKKLERYLNSRRWVVFSTEKYIIIDDQDFSLPHVVNKKNYREVFNKAQINTKVLLLGDHNKLILPYRELQSRNKKVYMIKI